MIELNLLRERQDRFLQKRVIFRLGAIYLGGLALILMVAFINFFTTRMQVEHIRNNILQLNEKMKKEYVLIEKLESDQKELVTLNRKLVLCRTEKNGRVTWTDKIGIITAALPKNMWLGKLSLTQAVMDDNAIKLPVQAGQAEPPRMKRQALLIEGFIHPAAPERRTLAAFMDNLENSSKNAFSTISLKNVKRTRDRTGNNETVMFTIECGLKGNGETNK